MSQPEFDVIIVGSGAGGGVAAYVLAENGWRVALMEKGRNPYPQLSTPVLRGSLFGNDEIRLRRGYAFQDPFIEPRTYRRHGEEPAAITAIQELGVGVGGGTIQYDADSPRVTQLDLRQLSTFGPVEGAEVRDWPISYQDLAPYYDEVERLIGVQGEDGGNPFAEPRPPYPMPPGYPSGAGLLLSEGARSLGYHPHAMPMAVNSVAYRGRPACTNCGFCAMGCAVNAKGSTAVTVIRDALLTGNCTLLAECCAIAVQTDPSGERATGVRYIDPSGAESTITASHVVLAANAIETPRLLFLSASQAHPDGLGNESGLVGRHLMFHIVFSALGIFSEEMRTYRGRPITHAMADFTVDDGNEGFIRGGYVELGGSLHPVQEGVLYPWYLHNEMMRDRTFRNNIGSVAMMGIDMPVASNRVELDDEVRDVYGLPVPRITYSRLPHDQAMVDHYLPKLEAIALAAGAESILKTDQVQRDGRPDTKHLLGTTRMGLDPKTSVTNPWGRLHGVQNVWIADGSLWPTSTAYNPTLTQQALAYRTAAHMINPGHPEQVLS